MCFVGRSGRKCSARAGEGSSNGGGGPVGRFLGEVDLDGAEAELKLEDGDALAFFLDEFFAMMTDQ